MPFLPLRYALFIQFDLVRHLVDAAKIGKIPQCGAKKWFFYDPQVQIASAKLHIFPNTATFFLPITPHGCRDTMRLPGYDAAAGIRQPYSPGHQNHPAMGL